jgi:GntR family transcriptional regulator
VVKADVAFGMRVLKRCQVTGRPAVTYAGKVTVDHFGEVPAYLQLAAILREQITSGELPPRTPLPSIRTLMQTYDVAKGTVEKALAVLRAEGWPGLCRGAVST